MVAFKDTSIEKSYLEILLLTSADMAHQQISLDVISRDNNDPIAF